MPLYEFKCQACGEEFELICKASEKETIRCPSCEAPAEKKLSVFAMGGGTTRTCSPGSGGSFGGG